MDRIHEETEQDFEKNKGLMTDLCPLEARDRENTITSAPSRMVLVLKPFPSARKLESNRTQAAKRRSWPTEKATCAQLQMTARKSPTKECHGNDLETNKSLQMCFQTDRKGKDL